MKAKKIKLSELKVNSFKTSLEVKTIKGGMPQNSRIPFCGTHNDKIKVYKLNYLKF